MPNQLRNIPENFIFDLIPENVGALDARHLMQAILAGVQDRIQDIRAYVGNYPELVNPDAGQMTVVLATYTAEAGNVVTVSLNVTETTPEDPTLLIDWAAEQMQLDASVIQSAVMGTDALRTVDANVLSYLATTLGVVLCPALPGEDPTVTTQRQQLEVESHFPRLKMKGTPESFTILAKLAGFDDGTFTPLWSRISPRDPANPSNVDNLDDLRPFPDFYPVVGDDPIYKPYDFTDGPFYGWRSQSLVTDPTDGNYYLTVNGVSPFITLRTVSAGTVVNPTAGTYTLYGGAVGVKAGVILDRGTLTSNLAADAIGPGASFNGLNVVVIADTGSTRVMSIVGQLSTVKYRSSYFDAKVWVEDAGTVGVLPNLDLEADPDITDDGVASAPWRPWTGGQSPVQVIALWPNFAISSGGTVRVARWQASGTNSQVDTSALMQAGAQVFDQLDEIQLATRLPRYRGVGVMTRDEIALAPFPAVYDFTTSGQTGYLWGAVPALDAPTPPYTGDFYAAGDDGVTTSLTSQEVNDYGTLVSFAGATASGTYNFGDNTWNMTVVGSFAGTIRASWSPLDEGVVRSEPTVLAAYQTRPEGTVQMVNWGLTHDDYNPWVSGRLMAAGAPVDINTFEPVSGDPPARQVPPEAFVSDSTNTARRLRVIDITDDQEPYRIRALPSVTTSPVVRYAAAGTVVGYDGSYLVTEDEVNVITTEFGEEILAVANTLSTVTYPVILIDTQVMAAGIWSPARRDSLFSWWPMTEHPSDHLTTRDIIRETDVPLIGINPDSREYDASRGWSLNLTGGGTILAPIMGAATTDYSFSFWARPLPGHTSTGADYLFSYGPVNVEMLEIDIYGNIGVRLAIAGTTGGTIFRTPSLALDFDENFITGVISGQSASLGVSTKVAGSITQSGVNGAFSAAAYNATYGFTGPWNDVRISDLSVWSTAKTVAELELVRRPHVSPVSYDFATYVLSSSDDRYTLEILPDSGFVVPRSTEPDFESAILGTVQRYDSAGRFNADPEFKLVGLGDAQIVPPVMRLGTSGPAILATGAVVLAGTNPPIPGWTRAWNGTLNGTLNGTTSYIYGTGTVYNGTVYPGLLPPYSATGGVNVEIQSINPILVGQNVPWPGYLPNYNGVVDRIYVKGDTGSVYAVRIDDVGNGPTFVAQIVLHERPTADLASGVPASLMYKDEPTDAITTYSSPGQGQISVDAAGTVYQNYSGFNYWDPTLPPYMYLTSKVIDSVPWAFTQWVNQTSYGQGLGQAALDSNGSLIFENSGVVPAGNYRLTFDCGNDGAVDEDFDGFAVEVTLVGQNNQTIIVDTVLLPDGIGTDPRDNTAVEFKIPEDINGNWMLTLAWSNDLDVVSRGQQRRLVIYSYELRQVINELYFVTSQPLGLIKVDTTDSSSPLKPGAWVARYNSYGTIASLTHEVDLYSVSSADLTSAASPLADTLTGSTYGRIEELQVNNPYTPINSPAAGTLSPVVLGILPSVPYYNVGDQIYATITGATGGVSPLSYVWYFWGAGTVTTSIPSMSARVDRGGTLPVQVLAVDSLGQSSQTAGSIYVNYPPSVDLLTSSKNNYPPPYMTTLSAVVTDVESDAVITNWYNAGTLFYSGSVVNNYTVTEAHSVNVTVYDTRGGTNFADIYLGTVPNQPPTVSLSYVPERLKANYPYDIKFAAIASDPQGENITSEWTFWDSGSSAGNMTRMNYFGAGTYCTVQKNVGTDVNPGTRILSVKVTDDSGLSSTAGASIEFVQNSRPVISSVSVSAPGVARGQPLYYKASAYDPDGDVLNYKWVFSVLHDMILYGPNVDVPTGLLSVGTTVTGILYVYDNYGGEAIAQIPQSFISASGLSPIAITPAGGYSQIGIVATISSPDTGVTIRYTIDGTDPQTIDAGQIYTGPIMLPFENATTPSIRARAFKVGGGYAPSTLAVANFIFFNPSGS